MLSASEVVCDLPTRRRNTKSGLGWLNLAYSDTAKIFTKYLMDKANVALTFSVFLVIVLSLLWLWLWLLCEVWTSETRQQRETLAQWWWWWTQRRSITLSERRKEVQCELEVLIHLSKKHIFSITGFGFGLTYCFTSALTYVFSWRENPWIELRLKASLKS